MEISYTVNFTQDICRAKSAVPQKKVLALLENQEETLKLTSQIVKST